MASLPRVHLAANCVLQGKTVRTRDSDRLVYAFRGVPYASPPVGTLRFKKTQPLKLWNGVRDATNYGPICPQPSRSLGPFPMPEKMDEDCLYLNVYTPTLDRGRKCPVMMWIHGGSFTMGFSDIYDGTPYASHHDVVFVSINYRLGAFGFLSTGDESCLGNAGLWDQVEALKWIQRYIREFGGDPENVTVFGESAGAISTSCLLTSPHTKGLFHRAILQSGTAVYASAVWGPQNANKFIRKKAEKSGMKFVDTQDLVNQMKSKPVDFLVNKFGNFAPIVFDGHFFPEHPVDTFRLGKSHPVPVITGINSHEGAQFITDDLGGELLVPNLAKAEDILRVTVRERMFRGLPLHKYQQIEGLLRRWYLERDNSLEGLTRGLVEMYGDVVFTAPCVGNAAHLAHRAATYLYVFSHRPFYSGYPSWIQADHGNEIPFVLGMFLVDLFPDIVGEEEKRFSKTLMEYWTSFAKDGIPRATNQPVWPQYDTARGHYLHLTPEIQVDTKYKEKTMDLWNSQIAGIVSSKAKY